VQDFDRLDVRLVLIPDRRQHENRRGQSRGGRRASDRPAFGLSFSADAHDLWTVADDIQLPPGKTVSH